MSEPRPRIEKPSCTTRDRRQPHQGSRFPSVRPSHPDHDGKRLGAVEPRQRTPSPTNIRAGCFCAGLPRAQEHEAGCTRSRMMSAVDQCVIVRSVRLECSSIRACYEGINGKEPNQLGLTNLQDLLCLVRRTLFGRSGVSGNRLLIYWDSCVFIAWLKDEKRKPGILEGVAHWAGLLTSVITTVEILEGHMSPEVKERFNRLFDRTNINTSDVTDRIAAKAHELRDSTHNKSGRRQMARSYSSVRLTPSTSLPLLFTRSMSFTPST
jgi:hypothetical protein